MKRRAFVGAGGVRGGEVGPAATEKGCPVEAVRWPMAPVGPAELGETDLERRYI